MASLYHESPYPARRATIGAMKVYLHSIGCRLNQSEMETLARQLLAAGHQLVDAADKAEKVVINTCAVTASAAKDARRLTRGMHRRNSDAEILLTGCYATIAPAELDRLTGVSQVVPNSDKGRLIQILDPHARHKHPVYDQEPILRELLTGNGGANTRAFVKVQDGCDNRCTFCVTTIARGQGRSRHLGDVVAEIQALAAAGYREAVLTGVHLGSYGRDLANGTGLRELVAAILTHTDIPRLRLSSLEPWDIQPGLFDLWADQRLLPHLHVPLQSGCDRTLRRMARRTTRKSFRRLASEARAAIPHLNLSTDIIVGFPGETAADFQKRPGTAAAAMPGHLTKKVKKERVRRMIDLGQTLSRQFHQRYVGQSAAVLWEQANGADEHGLRWLGYTRNYIRVSAHGPSDLFNQIHPAQLLEARWDGIRAAIL